MTHGEEPGPETHRDSAVLTYLEGLLMHPVASGPGATVTRRTDADNNNGGAGNQGTRGVQLPNHGSSLQEKRGSTGVASQHLKKARLLCSETWSKTDNHTNDFAAVQVNDQGKDHHKISLDNSAQGESTLLASLLQSFSSRLQTVAMSQNITQSHKHLGGQSGERSPTDKDTLQGYCTASSRLKTLIRKNKQQSHNTVPYSRRNQDQRSASPCSSQSSVPDKVSCAERLKAVASLVKSRTSPAPSPKPSVACSQLALLLSSEAHLQQYSQEQALKAQLCGRSASERLAAMATQQNKDNSSPSVGESVFSPDILGPFNALNGTLPSPSNCTQRSPSLSLGQSAPTSSPLPSPHALREKRQFDRHSSRPAQNCSSLLLLLLNNHNSQKHLTKNGHLEDDFTAPLSQSSSHQSDSEYSNTENSLTKDSSDAESCYSSCSPIDLSMRSRVSSQKMEPPCLPSSLDKLTETLISKWKSETFEAKVPESKELEMSPDIASHHKVTLMQLLLDCRNNETVNKIAPHPDLQDAITLRNITESPLKRHGILEGSETKNPVDQLMGRSLSTSSLSEDTSKTPSPYSYSSPLVQSSPLNLCKSKQNTSDNLAEHAFTASKLLQNLAQCGLQNVPPLAPLQSCRPPSGKWQSPELDRSQTPLGMLSGPNKKNKTPLFEPPPATFLPFSGPERSPLASTQIENLLERRTILQLLLGTASSKEKSTGRRSTDVAIGVHEEPSGAYFLCDGSNIPSNVAVKTEPADESLLSVSSHDAVRQWKLRQRSQSPAGEAHSNVEAKCGLLSQLLKQKTTTYHSSPCTEHIVSTVKEEQQDNQVPLPKKRKLCFELAEHLSKELCQRPVDTVSESLVSNTRDSYNEAYNSKRLPSPKEEDSFIKCPARKTPTRDSQSFNVLKQLLLSDNCLKEISQPYGAASSFLPQANCKANGNLHQSSYNHELVNYPWFSQTLNSGPGHYNPLSYTPENIIQGSLQNRSTSPKLGPKPVKKETESPQSWTFAGEEDKCESNSDSPPLMRSNPILYCMLQRRNSQIKNEVEDHAQRMHSEVTVKLEPCADDRYHDDRITKSSSVRIQRHGNGAEHFRGLSEKPQI